MEVYVADFPLIQKPRPVIFMRHTYLSPMPAIIMLSTTAFLVTSENL